jgi:hypothetical protein
MHELIIRGVAKIPAVAPEVDLIKDLLDSFFIWV